MHDMKSSKSGHVRLYGQQCRLMCSVNEFRGCVGIVTVPILLLLESLDRYRWEDKMTDRQTDRPTDRQIRDQKAITDQTAEIFLSGLYVPQ